MPYEIDDVPLVPQPTEHRWNYPNVLGADGNGAPVLARYSSAILRCDLTIQYHDWFQWMDGNQHTVSIPAPGTTGTDDADWVAYASVYVYVIEDGDVRGAQKGNAGMRRVEMRITGITV